MTQNTAIICETNPFHKGHKYLFDQVSAQNDGITIAIMSGNFVQRSIPAVLDKYTRAGILVENGADLVVELPYPWCAAGGEAFAAGGVAIAAGLGADSLTFGSESGDIENLQRCAALLDGAEFGEKMRQMEQDEPGIGAAVLHERLLADRGFTLSPNDKLAVWYLRQMQAQQTALTPHAIRRTPHTDTVVSATKIRQCLIEGKDIAPYVPESVAEIYKSLTFTAPDRFYELVWLYFRLFHEKSLFAKEPNETTDKSGLLGRMTKAAQDTTNGEEFFERVATKKYTDARVRRTALFAMTDTPSPDTIGLPAYTILLGANERGRAYLNSIRKTAGIPILTKPAHGTKLPLEAQEQYQWQECADRLYATCRTPAVDGQYYMRQKPIMILPSGEKGK